MSYKCIIQKNPEYLRVDVSGDWSPGKELEDALSVWSQVAEACKELEAFNVLAVWDVPGRLPTFTAFQLGSMAHSFGIGHKFKLAIVHLNEERLKDSLFAETVAVNRGFQVKMFSDETQALSWLLS